MNSLKEAFTLFSKETARLEESYRGLQEECKQLTQKIESSALTFGTIVKHLSEGLIFVSSKGMIELFNDAAARFTGYKSEDIHNCSYWNFFTDDFFGFSMKSSLEESHSSHKTVLTLHLENNSYAVEVSSSLIPEKGILLLLRDLSDQRLLEQALARNDRLRDLGEMAASLAHEIRNPLGGIQGFASLLCQDLTSFPEQKKMAQTILEGTHILNRLVTNVLNYARPVTLHLAPLDPNVLIKDTLSLISASLQKPLCHFQPLEKPPLIYADSQLLKMALLNLLQNAFQATEALSPVEITLNERDDWVSFSIKDSGDGIPEEHLEKIFLPFFTTKENGTGLGLSETQKIIHAHAGTLDVHSKVGVGSTFTMRIPKYASDRKNSSRG